MPTSRASAILSNPISVKANSHPRAVGRSSSSARRGRCFPRGRHVFTQPRGIAAVLSGFTVVATKAILRQKRAGISGDGGTGGTNQGTGDNPQVNLLGIVCPGAVPVLCRDRSVPDIKPNLNSKKFRR